MAFPVVLIVISVVLVGLAAAVGVSLLVGRRAASSFQQTVDRLQADMATQQQATQQAALERVLTIADQTLRTRAEEVVAGADARFRAQAQAVHTTATADLDSRKELIDQRLGAMSGQLEKLTELMVSVDRDRERSYGELSGRIEETARSTESLAKVTGSLHQALSSSQSRGQWGERMAEDVLRAAGFRPGINYHKERTLPCGTRPDFTFLLPGDRVVHMDAKFPLPAYLRYLEAETDFEREQHRKQFIRDASERVKELTTRGYVDPSAGTVDYLLMFIPNESVYQFICDTDPDFLDRALGQKVVCCSPMTLFAVLGVIRQAVDNFMFEQRSQEILELLSGFLSEYDKFMDQVDKVGGHLERTGKAYEILVGTRRRAMQRMLDQIDELRTAPDLDNENPPMVAIEGRDLDRQATEGVA